MESLSRENTQYGLDRRLSEVVYEARGTGEIQSASQPGIQGGSEQNVLTELDILFQKIKAQRTTREVLGNIPERLQTAPEQLQSIREQLDLIQHEFNELVEGKDNLLKLVINNQKATLSPEQIKELSGKAVEELATLVDQQDMNQTIAFARDQIEQIESDEKFQAFLNDPRSIKDTAISVLANAPAVASEDQLKDVQIFTSPSSTKLYVELADVNERLSELERIVGINTANRLKYSFTDMPSALCQLTHQLVLLEPQRIEALKEKAVNLNDEYKRLSSVIAGTGEHDRRINTLYTNMNRWLTLSHSLPKVRPFRFIRRAAHGRFWIK
ncbi:dynamitin [Gregarina niphandrodes]|uniref:Dynamitin n=1 Tax=Gregarina niphandrodes TaxID=110365 RepID=A0A023BAQ5_GRENI|nr:dynamitin [Gregarina niphandrodes]EZG78479.1 dynamitin [Gregarina niphandrodes]|eukprot:XP_011129283.1 dynamitin [Gregarina niphandrodes]